MGGKHTITKTATNDQVYSIIVQYGDKSKAITLPNKFHVNHLLELFQKSFPDVVILTMNMDPPKTTKKCVRVIGFIQDTVILPIWVFNSWLERMKNNDLLEKFVNDKIFTLACFPADQHERELVAFDYNKVINNKHEKISERKMLCEELHLNGIAIIKMNGECKQIISDIYSLAEEFFSLNAELKNSMILKESYMFVGYSGTSEREFVQTRMPISEQIEWLDGKWDKNKEWKKLVIKLHKMFSKISHKLLYSIQQELGIEKNIIDGIIENERLFGADVMRIYQYNLGKSNISGTGNHTDMGLITLLPLSTMPLLKLLSLRTGKWFSIEEMVHEKFSEEERSNMMFLFIGEQLAKLTDGYLSPVIHYVDMPKTKNANNNIRYSIPYFCRASPDSLLPTIPKSNFLQTEEFSLPFKSHSEESQTVSNFMKEHVFKCRDWHKTGMTDW